MACPDEISCDDAKMGDSQLFRKLLRKVGDCFYLAVTAVFTLSSTQRTVTRVLHGVAASAVAAGARSVTLETSSDFTGTILGVIASPDRAYDFSVKQNDDTLGAIAFEVTAGSIIETKIV